MSLTSAGTPILAVKQLIWVVTRRHPVTLPLDQTPFRSFRSWHGRTTLQLADRQVKLCSRARGLQRRGAGRTGGHDVADERWDFIVVGGGSAGSVVAGRLAGGGARVLLLEAGGTDRRPDVVIPAGVVSVYRSCNYRYAPEPDASRAGAVEPWPAGRHNASGSQHRSAVGWSVCCTCWTSRVSACTSVTTTGSSRHWCACATWGTP